MNFLARTVLPSVALLLVGSAAQAQDWTADLYAGRALYGPVSASVHATSLIGGLRYGSVQATSLYLAAALPLDDAAGAWGAAGATRRLGIGTAGRLRTGLDLGGHGYVHRDGISEQTGLGATLEAGAFGEAALRQGRVALRTFVRQYLAEAGDERASRTTLDGELRVESVPRAGVRVGGAGRWVQAAEGGYPAVTADVAAVMGPAQVLVAAEQWLGSNLRDTGWSATLGVDLRVVNAWAAVRQETRDPLYWNPSRRSWSVGISRSLGAARPTPRPVVPQRPGRARLQLAQAAARGPIQVAGDFTGWQPRPMRLAGGVWEIEIVLAPGVYNYAFVDGAGRWFVPEDVPGRVDDGMGGHVAVLVVE